MSIPHIRRSQRRVLTGGLQTATISPPQRPAEHAAGPHSLRDKARPRPGGLRDASLIPTQTISTPGDATAGEQVRPPGLPTRSKRGCAAAVAVAVTAAGLSVAVGAVAAPAAVADAPSLHPSCEDVLQEPSQRCTETFTTSGSASLSDLGWAPGSSITIMSAGGAGGAAADRTPGGHPGDVQSSWTPTSLVGGISWSIGGNGQNGVLSAGGAGGAGGLPGGAGAGGAGGNGSIAPLGSVSGGGGGGGGGATAVYGVSGTIPTASSQNLLQVSPGAGGAADLQGFGGNASQAGAGAVQSGHMCQGGAAATTSANGVGTCGGADGAATGGAGFRGDDPGANKNMSTPLGMTGPIDGGGGGGGGVTGGAGGGNTYAENQSMGQNGGTGGGGGYGTGVPQVSNSMINGAFESPKVTLTWFISSATTTTVNVSKPVASTTGVVATATWRAQTQFAVGNLSAAVQFNVDGAPYGPVLWVSQMASSTLRLPAGTHTVTATAYPKNFDPSTSAPVTVIVNPPRWDHATRSDNGAWTPAGDAGVTAHIPGTIVSVAAAATGNGIAQYVTATSDGRLWHTTRNADGSWSAAPDDVAAAAHIPGTVTNVAGSASAAGESQYLVVTSDGRLWHTIRHADGSWDTAGDAAAAAHIPGTVINAAVTSVLGISDMQFLVITSNGKVWHTIRHADTTWDPAADAAGAAHVTSAVISVAATSNHVAGSQFLFLTDDGHAWYATRQVNGSWTPAIDASAAANIPGAAVAAAESWTVTDNTEFMIVTADGQAWHTIRHTDGSWDPANSATTTLGLTPTAVGATAICTTSGEIQYTIATD